MTIDEWLKKFKNGWLSKDVSSVLPLFSEDVIYYETPFVKLDSYALLKKEWSSIRDQDDIYLDFELFSTEHNNHTIIWRLRYVTSKNSHRELRGTYLISLNDIGLCTYFHQTGELKADYL